MLTMNTPKKIKLHFVGAVAITGLITVRLSAQISPDTQELVRRGAYCAHAGDCIGCHTAQKGEPFAGGAPFTISVGKVYSTNITPDIETGIGRYNMKDFVKVMHEGVAKDGHRLYPAMPYTSYVKVSHKDLTALYAYFMLGIKPVHSPNRPAQLNWPLGVRSFMAIWNALYFKKGEYAANENKGVSWNRGAYLVQGLGHCGDCHTPRGIAGQVKATDEHDQEQFLTGAIIDNWYASPLNGDPQTGLYAWSKDEIIEYLKTGRTDRLAASGVMAGVVGKSTQYLTDIDLIAIAEYLKSLPPPNNKRHGNADSAIQTNAASAATRALRAGDTGMRGSRVYLDNCNACHGSDGEGARRTFPNLARNENVNAQNPVSLIHIILSGSSMPSTQTAPSAFAMPGFGWRLTDDKIADVLAFVRNNWGNHAAAVSRQEVSRVRKAILTK
jgi:alcohol dehydrogenase (quinone), cytochrome c subunit